MDIVCKFSIEKLQPNENDGFELGANAVADGSPENEKFFKYTPWGVLSLGTINPNIAEEFAEGDEVYLVLTKKNPFVLEG